MPAAARIAEPIDLDTRSEGWEAETIDGLRRVLTVMMEGRSDGVYAVDRRGRTQLITPSLTAMTGYTTDDVIGRLPHELLHHSHSDGAHYPHAECPIFHACQGGHVQHAQEVFWRKDGTSFPVDYTTAPLLKRGDVIGSVVVVRALDQKHELCDRIQTVLDIAPDEGGDAARVAPVGVSAAWKRTMDLVQRVASVDTTVILLGESGTGKELVARELHERSPRRSRPLVTLNCAAVPAHLVESELFGHERGAFTGAVSQRLGRFEQAQDGTLFLDEVGELTLDAQAKLLRVLQSRSFERVGGMRSIRSAARVVAATNRDLGAMVAAGQFRLDLYYRLSVFPIRLPPLRERRDDIPVLVSHFLKKLEPRFGRRLTGFTPDAERALHGHAWPGNVRELENVVERAALICDGAVLDAPDLDQSGFAPPSHPSVCRGERVPDRAAIVAALAGCGWKLSGNRGAAAALSMHPNTLRKLMVKLSIERPLP